MSVSNPTADSSPATQDVGVARVLDRVVQPGENQRPHVVEFRQVTKTYNAGMSNEFTAIRDVLSASAAISGEVANRLKRVAALFGVDTGGSSDKASKVAPFDPKAKAS